MVTRQHIGIFAIVLVIAGVFLFSTQPPKAKPQTERTSNNEVAIVFPVTIDSFVQMREAFKARMISAGFDVVWYSAEGDAGKFDSTLKAAFQRRPRIIVTVGTQLTTLALAPQFDDVRTVLVASCIASPADIEHFKMIGVSPPRKEEVAIISNTPEDDQYKFSANICKHFLSPNAQVGIIYNKSEQNALHTGTLLADAFESEGVHVQRGYITGEADIEPVTQVLLSQNVALMLIPLDKAATKHMSTISKLCTEKNVPVVALDDGAIDRGACVAISVPYRTMGEITAEMCVKIAGGSKASQMPVAQLTSAKLFVNRPRLAALGLELPTNILQQAEIR